MRPTHRKSRISCSRSRSGLEPSTPCAAWLGARVAQELEDPGVTANVIIPSVIDTPATRKALPFADYINWPTPDQIAAVIEFVLSDPSAVISGAMIPVYGRT